MKILTRFVSMMVILAEKSKAKERAEVEYRTERVSSLVPAQECVAYCDRYREMINTMNDFARTFQRIINISNNQKAISKLTEFWEFRSKIFQCPKLYDSVKRRVVMLNLQNDLISEYDESSGKVRWLAKYCFLLWNDARSLDHNNNLLTWTRSRLDEMSTSLNYAYEYYKNRVGTSSDAPTSEDFNDISDIINQIAECKQVGDELIKQLQTEKIFQFPHKAVMAIMCNEKVKRAFNGLGVFIVKKFSNMRTDVESLKPFLAKLKEDCIQWMYNSDKFKDEISTRIEDLLILRPLVIKRMLKIHGTSLFKDMPKSQFHYVNVCTRFMNKIVDEMKSELSKRSQSHSFAWDNDIITQYAKSIKDQRATVFPISGAKTYNTCKEKGMRIEVSVYDLFCDLLAYMGDLSDENALMKFKEGLDKFIAAAKAIESLEKGK